MSTSSSTRFIIYVFLCLTYTLCTLTFVFIDLYLKTFTERYGDKNCVDLCKLDKLSNVTVCSCTRTRHVHSVFFFVCVCVCVLLIHDALILLLSENKIIICD